MLDIVIPVFGEFDFLTQCLQAVPEAVGSGIQYQIIIVDNGSPDRAEANKYFSNLDNILTSEHNVQTYRWGDNKGFPWACNEGVAKGSAEFVCILTPDVVMKPGSIETLFNEIQKDSKIGVIGPKLVFPEGSPHGPVGKVQHAGLDMDIHGNIVHTFIGWDADNPKVNTRIDVFAITGAMFMTRRALWKAAGGLSEDYGKGTYEDVEYSLTIKSFGYTIIYEPRAVGTHFVGATVKKGQGYELNKNKQIFAGKWQAGFLWSQWKRW